MVQMAVLSALAFILILLIRFPIFPATPYLVYDPGDIPLLIGAFMFGPVSGIIMAAVVSALQALFLSGDGIVGFAMHLMASGALVGVAGLIYRRFHTRRGALAALICGTVAMGLVMIPANLIFTVHAYGVPYETVMATMPFTVGFNLLKAGINSVVVFLIYKPLSRYLRPQHSR
ncbi:MAG: ECF transporter S component [Clostridia bacterium]|nr:ECF transporter S component [Clostridia bacterium]